MATKYKSLKYMCSAIFSMIREITNTAMARIVLVIRRRSTVSVIVRESVISSNQNDMKYHALTMQQSMKALVLSIIRKICVMRKGQIS